MTLAETRRRVDVSNYIHEEETLKLHESRCKVYLYPECITPTHTPLSYTLALISDFLLSARVS